MSTYWDTRSKAAPDGAIKVGEHNGTDIYVLGGKFGAYIVQPGVHDNWVWRPTMAAIKRVIDGEYRRVKALYVSSGYRGFTLEVVNIVGMTRGKYRTADGRRYDQDDLLYHHTPALEATFRQLVVEYETLLARWREVLRGARRLSNTDVKRKSVAGNAD